MGIELLIGSTFDVAGKILIALSVFFVHNRVMKEKKIDKRVVMEMKKERNLAILGIILIAVGYLLQLPSRI